LLLDWVTTRETTKIALFCVQIYSQNRRSISLLFVMDMAFTEVKRRPMSNKRCLFCWRRV